MQKILAFLTILRPVNVIIGIFSIFIGAFITGTIQPITNVILVCISGGIMAGAANAINDYYDLEIDKINKPHRPLPSGKLNRTEVFWYANILFSIGVLLGAFVNKPALLIVCISTVLLFLYSAKLKRTVLWGNLCVSLATALAFIYGGIAVNRFYAALIPAGFSFLFHFGREIIKDTQDIEGDSANQIMTLPIKYGKQAALTVASFIYLALIVATILPYYFDVYGFYYFIIVLVGVDFVVVAALVAVWINQTPANLGRMSNLLKADMLMGLIAIYFGQFQ